MKEQYIKIVANGDKYYFADKAMTTLHREDGPAVEWDSGSKQWWVDGKLHRTDGPAVEHASGDRAWWVNYKHLTEEQFNARFTTVELTMDQIAAKFGIEVSKLKITKQNMKPQYITIDEYGDKYYYADKAMTIFHREDGPAIEYSDGSKEWRVDGELHRTDGPAAEFIDGYKSWFVNGSIHRLDGPAVIWGDGTKAWYVDDKQLTEEQFNARLDIGMDQIAANFGIVNTKITKQNMKLYLISQTENNDYDTYDSAVVYAPDEDTARNLDPLDGLWMTEDDWSHFASAWCSSSDAVSVKYLGEAPIGVETGVVCSSFNAG